MKLYKFKSIRTRLTFWFLMLSIVPLMIVLVMTYFQRAKVIERNSFNKLTAIRDLKVETLNIWLAEREGDIFSIAHDIEFNPVKNLINKSTYNQSDLQLLENIRNLLKNTLLNYASYYDLFLINPTNGEILVATNPEMVGEEKTTEEYFIKAMRTKKLVISDIYFSNSLSDYTMAYSIPIFSSETNNKKIIGILVARLDLENSLYKNLLNRVGLGKTGETLIVNKDAVALNELRWYDNAPLNLQIYAEPAINAANGETGIISSRDYRNEKILAAYTFIPSTGWGFICKQDTYELNAPIRDMLWNFILIFFISVILIIVIAVNIGRSITKPIIFLNLISHKIQDGDYSARNTIKSDDEIGSLANAFNSMADVIASRIIIQDKIQDISNIMLRKTDMKEFGKALLNQLMSITKANMSTFYVLNEASSEYEHFASVGANTELLKPFRAKDKEGEFGNALASKSIYYLRDIPENTVFKFKTVAGEAIPREIITIPILIEDSVAALISLVKIQVFSNDCLDILKQAWPNINTSYSNLMANERTRIFAEHLSKINQQLESQSEELQDQAEELQDQADELQRSSEELQEQNIELEAQRKQVESANKLKSEFLSNMSHELRTPLNSIMALSRVLIMQAKDKLNKEENNYLEIVERNGKRLLSLINDILDLSKIEAGKMDVLPTYIQVGSFLQMIKENMQSLAEEKGLVLKLDIPENLPQIQTDESRLHQVLTNIVSNAIKFTPQGRVEITANSTSENIFIDISDSGIGISEEELPFIFNEFRQADGSSARQYEGTGLGLAIADKMMKVLGGKINVKSTLGKGSVFTVKIPIKWHEEILYSNSYSFENNVSFATEKTILIVDDDPKTVKIISDYLNGEGYRTIGTTSGKEGLQLAEKYQPFAITLDIIMPEIDGWEVLQELKSNNKTKDIPVIVVSVADDRDTGLALGAVGFINKPIEKDVLVKNIRDINKSPARVMVVDDNEFELKQISGIIESEGIRTIRAQGGNDCIKILEETLPDILILDLMMPDIDGFTVLDHIRHDDKTKNLPVIIVTAKDLSEKEKDKLRGNISSLICKRNIQPQFLLKEIKRIIQEMEKMQDNNALINNNIRKKILVVEDNPEAIIQVKTVLENRDYQVDIAVGGKQALDFLKHTIPDGIILDLMMPDIDGFEVLEKIRGTAKTKNIPVLILTAKDLTRDDLSKLSTNNIQQLVYKGDVDIDGLILKVRLMLGEEVGSMMNDERLKIKDERLKINVDRQKEGEGSGLLNVLIVEDNADNMTTIKAILKGKYNLSEAIDGEKGIEKAQTLLPDLILLDMSLPKLEGLKFIEILKSEKNTNQIPIIAVTAKAMKGDKEKILDKGCDGYVSKPIDNMELLEEIRRVIRD